MYLGGRLAHLNSTPPHHHSQQRNPQGPYNSARVFVDSTTPSELHAGQYPCVLRPSGQAEAASTGNGTTWGEADGITDTLEGDRKQQTVLFIWKAQTRLETCCKFRFFFTSKTIALGAAAFGEGAAHLRTPRCDMAVAPSRRPRKRGCCHPLPRQMERSSANSKRCVRLVRSHSKPSPSR
ncbi:hypothetical protein F442_11644 [Phytophthora nicotianae P10297]|uniref:Uncharacterized protein n=1 Tax=Phytophthora nicotianae P10297 TaxID=1317064 RepID=W2Z2K0_PHYNI|nr:hypothetical protein F442_11644 [Phytophthora nicotianae P10297]